MLSVVEARCEVLLMASCHEAEHCTSVQVKTEANEALSGHEFARSQQLRLACEIY
jgi:hypothetical protein